MLDSAKHGEYGFRVDEYCITIEVGFLWFGQLRDQLTEMAWINPALTWKEGRGWLDRKFYVRGPKREIENLAQQFDGWCWHPTRAIK